MNTALSALFGFQGLAMAASGVLRFHMGRRAEGVIVGVLGLPLVVASTVLLVGLLRT